MFKLSGRGWIALFFLGLAACQAQRVSPVPAPQEMRIGLSPLLKPWEGRIVSCASEIPSVHVILEETERTPDSLKNEACALQLGESPDLSAFVTQVGSEELRIITSPGGNLSQVTLAELQSIYQGTLQDWAEVEASGRSGAITVWAYPEGNSLRSLFFQKILSGSASLTLFHLAPGPAQMLAAVGTVPNSIGFLPSSWVDDSVQQVEISGLPQDALKFPVLAVATRQPPEEVVKLLHCLAGSQ